MPGSRRGSAGATPCYGASAKVFPEDNDRQRIAVLDGNRRGVALCARMKDVTAARITRHARTEMARRGIAEEAIREVLRAPQAVMPGNRPGRQVFQGAARIDHQARRVLLRVVVDIGQIPPAVITAYGTTQFKRYGAKS
jgi:Domain of unknown function (DUF4258)